VEFASFGERKLYDEIVITPVQGFEPLAKALAPRDFTVLANVEGAWVVVMERTNETDWTTAARTFKFDNPVPTKVLRLIVSRVGYDDDGSEQDEFSVSEIEYAEALPFVVAKANVLEQRLADLVFKLYGVTNLEDAPQ
jgi:hypothetical protein